MEQFTNSVAQILDDGEMVLKAISLRQSVNPSSFDECRTLGETIKGMVKRGELLTPEQKIKLADYMLGYHTDYKQIARKYFELIDSAQRKES